jgi:hypothetical protein
MNLVIQKELVRKDSQLHEKDSTLQKIIEEREAKDNDITTLNLEGRRFKPFGLVCAFVVGLLFFIFVSVTGLRLTWSYHHAWMLSNL